MTDGGRTSSHGHPHAGGHPPASAPPASPQPAAPLPANRAGRLTAANMLRSMLPLVVIVLLIGAWTAWRQSVDVQVQTVDPSTTIQLAAARASYPVLAPSGLPEEYLVTSSRTDAGRAEEGDPVTLEIGYLTPTEEFAGFVVSDDPMAAVVVDVLRDATEEGQVQIAGEAWQQRTTTRGETAFVREADGVTVVVTGSAPDDELRAVAEAVGPYRS